MLHVDEPATWVVVAGIELHQIWNELVSARPIIVAMLVHLVVMVMVVVVYAHHLDRARFPERSLVVSGVAQHAVVRGEAPLAHALALIIVAMLVHMTIRVMVVYARHLDRAGCDVWRVVFVPSERTHANAAPSLANILSAE